MDTVQGKIIGDEELKESLNKNADDDSHKYLLSTLLAEVLFDKYENGTEAYKHHLLAQISNVLSGKLILEKMLENGHKASCRH